MELVRDLLTALFLIAFAQGGPASASDDSATPSGPECRGVLQQGGLLICEGAPGTRFTMGAVTLETGPEGLVVFGLRRDAPAQLAVEAETVSGEETRLSLEIAPREDPFRVIEGLDCDKVDARTPEQKAHAGQSWVKKQEAFARFEQGPGPTTGFTRPAEGRPSSPFGPERRYIGVSAVTGEPCDRVSVHRGYDIAAPVGTPILAPAEGIVILADPDLYYEGGTVFLDHGHGLVSVFMHMSRIDVETSDELARGDQLGAVGNTGRTTGPHLHWAVKWRDSASTDRSGDFYIDPALLMQLPVR